MRMNLSLGHCRSQCYDGASNMAGSIGGVAKQLRDEEERALFCHCYGHSLNRAASDAIKRCKVMSDALDTTLEISKLINFHPKGKGCLKTSRKNYLLTAQVSCRVLFPTRWTVRGESLQSVINNYSVLQEVWDECLESRLQPEIRSLESQMQKFNYIYSELFLEPSFETCRQSI